MPTSSKVQSGQVEPIAESEKRPTVHAVRLWRRGGCEKALCVTIHLSEFSRRRGVGLAPMSAEPSGATRANENAWCIWDCALEWHAVRDGCFEFVECDGVIDRVKVPEMLSVRRRASPAKYDRTPALKLLAMPMHIGCQSLSLNVYTPGALGRCSVRPSLPMAREPLIVGNASISSRWVTPGDPGAFEHCENARLTKWQFRDRL